MPIKALIFDVFGTVVDWENSVREQLTEHCQQDSINASPDLILDLTNDWRRGYYAGTLRIAKDEAGKTDTNVDDMHLEILNDLLSRPEYSVFAKGWDQSARKELCLVWHRLKGWPDSSSGLAALKKRCIIGTLSNGNARLLVDMAKYASLPWDVVFSGDILRSYKPNPATYLGACKFLQLPPSEVGMVAAHIGDLRSAASYGLQTIYVPRPTEDQDIENLPGGAIPGGPDSVKTKEEGGDVDFVAKDGFHNVLEYLDRVGT